MAAFSLLGEYIPVLVDHLGPWYSLFYFGGPEVNYIGWSKQFWSNHHLGCSLLLCPYGHSCLSGTCIALEEKLTGDVLYLGEGCNVSALLLKPNGGEITVISLNVPPEWLHWLNFFLLKKVIVSDTFKPLVHRYLRGSGWMKEMSCAQHSKEIMSYMNN